MGEHSRAACPIPNPTSYIPHSTSYIPHSTSTIPHSQHPSPKSTRFFPLRPAPRPNTPFSAHHCNRLTTSHLLSKPSRATFQTHHSPPRNAIFRPTIPALSKLHPLPFEAPSLTFRTSIPKPPQPDTCPTPASPSVYGLSTRSHSASQTSKPRLPALCFTPKSKPHISTKYLYPPLPVPTAKMILWNVMG